MTNDKQMTIGRKFDIYDRALEFAARVARLISRLDKSQALIEYGKQVIRASGSIGANMEEADGALTRKDFVNKMGIARREARESRHWLRLIKKVDLVREPEDRGELDWQLGEAEELLLILSSIINKTLKSG
ncbi:MAG: four helix bundle protein [Candidatus Aureabacteria bacterium]|nr:four helix bundle protein [Candidatus Auribacterota bacterium]